MLIISTRTWDDLKAERARLQDAVEALNRELGGLRTLNRELERENGISLAQQMNLVIVQLAVANDERTALLRAHGIHVNGSAAGRGRSV